MVAGGKSNLFLRVNPICPIAISTVNFRLQTNLYLFANIQCFVKRLVFDEDVYEYNNHNTKPT